MDVCVRGKESGRLSGKETSLGTAEGKIKPGPFKDWGKKEKKNSVWLKRRD